MNTNEENKMPADNHGCCGMAKPCSLRMVIGVILIIIGLWQAGKMLGILPPEMNINLRLFWPILFIGIGIMLVVKKKK